MADVSIQTRIELFILRLLAFLGVGRARDELRHKKLVGLEVQLYLDTLNAKQRAKKKQWHVKEFARRFR